MDPGKKNLAVVYRIDHKVMKTNISSKALVMSPNEETLLVEANANHDTIKIPRRIQWN